MENPKKKIISRPNEKTQSHEFAYLCGSNETKILSAISEKTIGHTKDGAGLYR